MSGSIFKPFVVLCRQNFIALAKIFFLTHPTQSFHHSTLWATHVIVNHSSDLLRNLRLACSVTKAPCFISLIFIWLRALPRSCIAPHPSSPPGHLFSTWQAFCGLSWSEAGLAHPRLLEWRVWHMLTELVGGEDPGQQQPCKWQHRCLSELGELVAEHLFKGVQVQKNSRGEKSRCF